MSDSKPLVSIGMPVYNGERYIRQALDSLLAQDYEHFELIVSDNASTDGTWEICQEYAARNRRLQCYRNETNLGSVANFNRLFELSSGKYFMWAAHDDLWDRIYVRKCLHMLQRYPSAILCCTDFRVISEGGNGLEVYNNVETFGLNILRRLRTMMSPLEVKEGTSVMFASGHAVYGLIRSDILRKTNLFRNDFGPDTILLIELCLFGEFVKVPETLFYWRRFRSKTEKTRTDELDPENKNSPWLSPYTELFLEALRTILAFEMGRVTKATLCLEAASVACFRNPLWRNRIRKETEQRVFDLYGRGNHKAVLSLAPFCLILNPHYLFKFKAWHIFFKAMMGTMRASFVH